MRLGEDVSQRPVFQTGIGNLGNKPEVDRLNNTTELRGGKQSAKRGQSKKTRATPTRPFGWGGGRQRGEEKRDSVENLDLSRIMGGRRPRQKFVGRVAGKKEET